MGGVGGGGFVGVWVNRVGGGSRMRGGFTKCAPAVFENWWSAVVRGRGKRCPVG